MKREKRKPGYALSSLDKDIQNKVIKEYQKEGEKVLGRTPLIWEVKDLIAGNGDRFDKQGNLVWYDGKEN